MPPKKKVKDKVRDLNFYLYGDHAVFPYLGTPQGYWRDGEKTLKIGSMGGKYIKNCIAMIDGYLSPHSTLNIADDQTVEKEIKTLLENKKKELLSFLLGL